MEGEWNFKHSFPTLHSLSNWKHTRFFKPGSLKRPSQALTDTKIGYFSMRKHFRVKNIIIFIISLTLLYQDYCTCMTKCISYWKILCAYSIFRSLIPITSPVMQTRFSTPPTILRRGRKRKVSFCWLIPLIKFIFFNNFCRECRVWGHKILLCY